MGLSVEQVSKWGDDAARGWYVARDDSSRLLK
jgi:hypothetical protein